MLGGKLCGNHVELLQIELFKFNRTYYTHIKKFKFFVKSNREERFFSYRNEHARKSTLLFDLRFKASSRNQVECLLHEFLII